MKTVIKVPLVLQVLKDHVVELVQPVPLVITDPKVLQAPEVIKVLAILNPVHMENLALMADQVLKVKQAKMD